jgi:hypothetical protein
MDGSKALPKAPPTPHFTQLTTLTHNLKNTRENMASKPTEMCVIETTGAREYKVWVYFHRLLSFFYREREREKSAE